MLAFLQQIGKALMLPVAVMPAAAILLRIGQPDLLNIQFMAAAGSAIFDNLAVLFAIGVAIGLAFDSNGAAAMAGIVAYYVLNKTIAAINPEVDMKIFAGIIAGIIGGLSYNKFWNIKLPDWLGFFAGRRFVPIFTSILAMVLGYIFAYAWIYVQHGIDLLNSVITNMGVWGAGIFGFLNRILIPVGLHHILNNVLWFQYGEFQTVITNSQGIEEVITKLGDLNRFFAGDPTAGSFMVGFFPVMMFGLPAVALAIYLTRDKLDRAKVAGLLLSLAITSFLTGITEPIEFLFMFVAPVLFVIHAVLTGVAMIVTNLLGIKHGFGFSGGAFDYVLNYGLATKPLLLLFVGIIFFFVYLVVFYFAIKKFNIKIDIDTPVDNSKNTSNGVDGDTKNKYFYLAEGYAAALGGIDNLENIDNCVTRLRLRITDIKKMDESTLKQLGAKAIVKIDEHSIQVVVGTDVEFISDELKQIKNKENHKV